MLRTSQRLKIYYVFLVVYFVFQVFFVKILRSYNEDTHTNALKIFKIYKELADQLNKITKYDNAGLFKILLSKELHKKAVKFDITLISQCSSNYISLIRDLKQAWKGPMSVAIFSEIENIEKTLWDLAKFKHCYGNENLGLHLVVPTQEKYVMNYEYGYQKLALSERSISCNWFSEVSKEQNYNWTTSYPINLLRNVAKSGSASDYILVLDIDMIPSLDLRTDFLSFVSSQRSNPENEVFVIPAFEIPMGVEPPRDKAELLRSIERDQARPFYIVPCKNCQKYTKYGDWLAAGSISGTKVLYEVEWVHPWEPFFISRRGVPDFDERFKQYGMNRVSQICEIYVAGYRFSVLDNVFLVHRGYKTGESFHRSKDKEMENNRRLYNLFKSELKYMYPGSGRNC